MNFTEVVRSRRLPMMRASESARQGFVTVTAWENRTVQGTRARWILIEIELYFFVRGGGRCALATT